MTTIVINVLKLAQTKTKTVEDLVTDNRLNQNTQNIYSHHLVSECSSYDDADIIPSHNMTVQQFENRDVTITGEMIN